MENAKVMLSVAIMLEDGTKLKRVDTREVLEVSEGFLRDKFGARIMLDKEYITAEYEVLPTEMSFNEAWEYYCSDRIIISLETKTRYRKINEVPYMLTKYQTKWVKVNHIAIKEIEGRWITKQV